MLTMCWFQAMKAFAYKMPTRDDPEALVWVELVIEHEMILDDLEALIAMIRAP